MYDKEVGNMGTVFIDGKQIIINNIKSFKKDTFNTKCLYKSDMRLQSRFKSGGQSAQRFDRIELGIRNGYLSKFDEKVLEIFYDKQNNKSRIDMLVICGPGTICSELAKCPLISKYYNNIVRVKPIAKFDVKLIHDIYYDDMVSRNNVHLSDIKELIEKADNRLLFGRDEVLENLKLCTIEKLVTMDKHITDGINYKPEIIIINNSLFLESYGGSIAVKYY
jgi:peptide subunit release factor 1 (eRF1)